jgi:hypothetical protein
MPRDPRHRCRLDRIEEATFGVVGLNRWIMCILRPGICGGFRKIVPKLFLPEHVHLDLEGVPCLGVRRAAKLCPSLLRRRIVKRVSFFWHAILTLIFADFVTEEVLWKRFGVCGWLGPLRVCGIQNKQPFPLHLDGIPVCVSNFHRNNEVLTLQVVPLPDTTSLPDDSPPQSHRIYLRRNTGLEQRRLV